MYENCNNILETIGNTPMVRLNKTKEIEATVLAKVEYFNPGSSVKDRMALKMVEDVSDGRLKPGGTFGRNIRKYGNGFSFSCHRKRI